MNADQRRQIFEQLRYDLRMAEAWADELNAVARSVDAKDAKVLYERIKKAMVAAEKLNDSFVPKENIPF